MRFRLLLVSLVACAPPPQGLRGADQGPGPQVKFEIRAAPLPEIPLPNDFASRFDALSPTKRRLNVAVDVAPTRWERSIRRAFNELSGWGTLTPITVSFSQPLDLKNITRRHQAPADLHDDAVFVFDVTRGSPEFCRPVLLDLGQGHFPVISDDRQYFPEEPHQSMESLSFEQEEEDVNGNGELDPDEDTDMDGVLDHPNTIDGKAGNPFDVIGFYERETETLIARPLEPMREGTTYAVVLTKRLVGLDGEPVRSPFPAIHHLEQTKALQALPECLASQSLSLDEVSFTWSFTTQNVTHDYIAVRDGFMGLGPLSYLKTKYPPDFSSIEDGRVSEGRGTNVKIVPGPQLLKSAEQLLGVVVGRASRETTDYLKGLFRTVDFYAAPTMVSPQFFPRTDSAGSPLPLYDQTMKLDSVRGVAEIRDELVPLFLSVPRNRKGPAPVVIFLHGHTGSKLDSLLFMGPMSRFGVATIGLDAVSHGLNVNQSDLDFILGIFSSSGMKPLATAITKGRAFDQNGDGVPDPGADFFTADVSHSRDAVKQTIFDIMRLVRILRSFDGQRTWKFDVNKDGQDDIAGDFDGDGQVDIGGPTTPLYLGGVSLGGILSSLGGGVEPDFDAVLPVLPGGYLSEIGTRTALGQVKNPLVLKMLAPLFLVRPDSMTGVPTLSVMHPSGTRNVEIPLAAFPDPVPGDVVVVRNLKTQEWRCSRIQRNGRLRGSVPADKGDPLQLEVYSEPVPTQPRTGCDPTGLMPVKVIDTIDRDIIVFGEKVSTGTKLFAFADGFGLRRGTPELRRLLSLGQTLLESGDPANFAPFYTGRRELTYGDKSKVRTRALFVPMTGDHGVPIATANALLRAAGIFDVRKIDPRFGKSVQQQLIDVGFVEGAERTRRHFDTSNRPALIDVDVLESVRPGADDEFGVPRMNPPLRQYAPNEAVGGQFGVIMPYMSPTGAHSLPVPDPTKSFDLGTLLFNVFGAYLGSGGERVALEACAERNTCDWMPPIPP